MTTVLDVGIIVVVLSAIIGCYAYVHKVVGDMHEVERDMGKKQKALEDCVEGALKDNSKALNKLAMAVTNRLTAIETQLGIQLPKKGHK